MFVLWLVMVALAGYLLGGINGAIIISRLLAHEDVRKKGSGNAGLTNFQRNYGNKGSLLVILVDVAKTVAACTIKKMRGRRKHEDRSDGQRRLGDSPGPGSAGERT